MDSVTRAVKIFFWFCLGLAAIVGWAIIEGLIWAFSHVALTWI